MRGCAISRQTSAEPTIGPTRLERSRTMLALSPGAAAACAAPASQAQSSPIAGRVISRTERAEVMLGLYSGMVVSPALDVFSNQGFSGESAFCRHCINAGADAPIL